MAYRTSEPDPVREIVQWLRDRSVETQREAGVGRPVDLNPALAHSVFLIAGEIERKWGTAPSQEEPTHPNGGYAYMGCRCRGCRS